MADARYVIETLLTARNNSAAAFAEAVGQAEAYREAIEENERVSRRAADSERQHVESLSRSQKELQKTGVNAAGTIAREMHLLDDKVKGTNRSIAETAKALEASRAAAGPVLTAYKQVEQRVESIQVKLAQRGLGAEEAKKLQQELVTARNAMSDFDSTDAIAEVNRLEARMHNLNATMEKLNDRKFELQDMFSRDERANAIERTIVKVESLADSLARLNADERASETKRVIALKDLEATTRDLQILMSEQATLEEALADTEARRRAKSYRDNQLLIAQEREIETLRRKGEATGRKIGGMVDLREIERTRKEMENMLVLLQNLGVEQQRLQEIQDEWSAEEMLVAQQEHEKRLAQLQKERAQAQKENNRILAAQIQEAIDKQNEAERERKAREREYNQDIQRRLSLERAYSAARAAAAKAGVLNQDVQDSSATPEEKLVVEAEFKDLVKAAQAAHAELEAAFPDVTVNVDADIGAAIAKLIAVRAAMQAVKDDAGRPADVGFFRTIINAAEESGNRIAAFDNQMRGAFTLLISVAIQPLATALVGLAAQFFAVASSAIYAGSAIGGALTSGVAQALPVIGVLGAALARMKSIFDVMQQRNLVDQQKFQRAAEPDTSTDDAVAQQERVRDANERVRDALERVADAQDNVKEARERLTEANRDAQRQLEDLIMTEREAELAARGAALTQEEAQDRMRDALTTGDTGSYYRNNLGIDEANLGVEQADMRLRRAREDLARGGNPQVEAAKKALDDAKDAVKDAQDGVEDARRGVAQAARGTDDASVRSFAAAAKLDYLTEQLSDTEKRLLGVFTRIYKLYSDPNGPIRGISDALLEGFIYAAEGIERIMQDPKLLGNLLNLAKEMADTIRTLFDELTSNAAMKDWNTFIKEATDNLPIVAEILGDLFQIFRDIGVAAAPIFTQMLEGIERFTSKIASSTGDRDNLAKFFREGMKHASAWWDLGAAFFNLFAALAGVGGGADSGLRTVERFTATVERATTWVEENSKKVRAFFKETEAVVAAVGRALLALGDGLLRAFDVGTVEALAELLEDVFIPALVMVIDAVGTVIKFFNDLTNIPIIGKFIELGAQLLIFGGLVGLVGAKLHTFFKPLEAAIKWLAGRAGITSIGGLLTRLGTNGAGALNPLGKAFNGIATAVGSIFRGIGDIIRRIPGLSRVGTALGGLGTRLGGGIGSGTGAPRTPMSVGRRAGIAGLVGAGAAVAVGSTGQQELADAYKMGDAGDAFTDFSNTVKNGFGSLLSLDFEGVGRSAKRFADNFVNGFTDMFGGDGRTDIEKFATDLEENFDKLVATRNVEGLRELSERAQQLAKDYPEFAEALGEVRQKAADAAEGVDVQRRALRLTEDVVDRLWKKGVSVPIDVRVNVDKRDLDELDFRLERLGSGVQRNLRELRGEIKTEMALIARTMGANTDQGKAAMAATLRQGVVGITKLIQQGKISVEEGGKQIQQYWKRINLMEGRDPLGLAQGFARKIQQGKGDRTKAIGGIVEELKQMPDGARRQASAATIAIARTLEREGKLPKGTAKRLASDLGLAFVDMRTKGSVQAAGLALTVTQWFNNMQGPIKTVMDWIGGAVSKSLKQLGGKAIDFAISNPPKALATAVSVAKSFVGHGGDAQGREGDPFVGLPGERGKDRVPRWLGRGEAVLNWAQQKAINAKLRGQDTIQSIVKRNKGWHAGGMGDAPGIGYSGGYAGDTPYGEMVGIPGAPGEFIRKTIVKQVAAVMSRFKMAVTDGFAPYGHDPDGDHPKGLGVDFIPGAGGNWDLVDKAAAWAKSKLGSVFRWIGYDGVPDHGRGHHLHLSWLADPSNIRGMIAAAVKKVKFKGDGSLHELGNLAIAKVTKQANEKIGELGSDGNMTAHPTGEGVMSRGEVMSVINRAMGIVGVPEALRPSFRSMAYDRARQESGFNPNAQNNWDSNAAAGDPSRGLFQTIGATFRSYMNPGMGNILNPLHNAVAAFKYMLAEYGGGDSWQQAIANMLARRGIGYAEGGFAGLEGFAKGGRIEGPDGAPIPILAHAGEWVLNKTQQAKAAALAGLDRAGLRDKLGFSGGPTSFKGGGEPIAGPNLAVGDSLSVGMKKFLDKMFKDLEIHAKEGRSSTQAFEILKEQWKKAYKNVIFDVGTNDEHAATLKKNLKRAHKLLNEDQEMIVSLVNGPGAKKKNAAIRDFAEGRENVSVVNPRDIDTGKDGIHMTPENYRKRAAAFRRAARETQYQQFELPDILPVDVKGLQKLLNEWNVHIRKINLKTKDGFDAVNKELARISRDGGPLDLLRDAIDARNDRREVARTGRQWDVTDEYMGERTGPRAGRRGPNGRRRRQRMLRGERVRVIEANENPLRDAELEVRDADRYLDDLMAFQRTVRKNIKRAVEVIERIRKRLKQLRKGDEDADQREEIEDLEKRLAQTQGNKRNFQNRAKQIADDIANAIADAGQKQADLLQVQIDRFTKRQDLKFGFMDLMERAMERVGDMGGLAKLSEQRVAMLRRRAEFLQKKIAEANEKGLTDLANTLGEELIAVWGEILTEAEKQVQRVLDYVSKLFGWIQMGIDLQQRRADLLERQGQPVAAAEARVVAQQNQTQAYQNQYAYYANMVANAGSGQYSQEQLEYAIEQMAELEVAILESAQTERDLQVAVIALKGEMAAARQNTVTGLYGTLSNIVNSLGTDGKGDVNELREILEGIRDAILQGTKETLAALMSNPLFKSRLDAYGINLNTTGQEFVDEMQQLLANWDEITAGMTQAEADAFRALIEQLANNQAALEENNDQLAELNGGNQELQGFSTSAWQMFQTAIFNGIGEVLPEYQIPAMQSGGYVTKQGIFELHPGERVLNPEDTDRLRALMEAVQQNQQAAQGDTININVLEQLQEAHADVIAAKLAWAKRTRLRIQTTT